MKHGNSLFVTLTYNDENLPDDGCVDAKETKRWIRRINKIQKVRYFVVGEYGGQTWRPHYHALLFGISNPFCTCCRHNYRRKNCDCVVARSWAHGNVYVGDVNNASASYTAGYVVKKMTKKDDKCLEGRKPEFARMSLKPGIGALAVSDIADLLKDGQGREAVEKCGDVPPMLLHGVKSMPLGRYLRAKIRKEIGLDEESTKEKNMLRWTKELNEELKADLADPVKCNWSIFKIQGRKNIQKIRNMEARFKIYGSKERYL